MRRERLERIATAERDRRAGRVELAVAAIGEPTEWPARVVLALAKLSGPDSAAAREVLEEGLDLWAAEMGLASLEEIETPPEPEPEPDVADPLADHLDRPFDSFELDRAFAQAEAQTDEMRNVNHVAERILMDEPVGLAEISDDPSTPIEALESSTPTESLDEDAMDAAFVAGEARLVAEAFDPIAPIPQIATDFEVPSVGESMDPGRSRRAIVLATLETWLQNLERRGEERAR